MEKKVKSIKLSDGTRQLGYNDGQGWVAMTNLYPTSYGYLGRGWASDNWSGVEKTIGAWKERIQKYVNDGY
jgi:hypothetical protein